MSTDARFEVDADIRQARTLPPEAFVDPGFLEVELDTIFANAWTLIPMRPGNEVRDDPRSLAQLVARRGSRAPVTVLDQPLYLQRDWEGRLHLFPNVCTHAWHTLVQGPDRARTVTCPQHGRQFDSEGHCLAQPGLDKVVPGFPGPEDHLRGLAVGEWGEFLFAALGKPEAKLDDVLAPVKESLARFPLDQLTRKPTAGEVREVPGNWKQHAWNYMDSLHIPFLHRKPGGLADAIDMATYRTELYSDAALQWVYAKDARLGIDPDHLPERFRDPNGRRVFALWWFVFPNLTLNVYPWGISINLYAPLPGAPRKTLFHWYHLALDDAKYARREEDWLMREVDAEDVDALSQVSRGAASGLAARGRFAPDSEQGPHWFHRKVAQAVATRMRSR